MKISKSIFVLLAFTAAPALAADVGVLTKQARGFLQGDIRGEFTLQKAL